ncbi:hypothetical protein C7M84_002085 [Penaeus vannamei]|uniref:Uncharacterized protein n=1 Tax=Penaeus vannamei TaxID=6689 RepID=A0A3R7PWE4_PENVA|nr:hypothetical protein C7M84_002085 [Penaeus vannamei]
MEPHLSPRATLPAPGSLTRPDLLFQKGMSFSTLLPLPLFVVALSLFLFLVPLSSVLPHFFRVFSSSLLPLFLLPSRSFSSLSRIPFSSFLLPLFGFLLIPFSSLLLSLSLSLRPSRYPFRHSSYSSLIFLLFPFCPSSSSLSSLFLHFPLRHSYPSLVFLLFLFRFSLSLPLFFAVLALPSSSPSLLSLPFSSFLLPLLDFPPIPLSPLLSLSLLHSTCTSLLLSITPTPLRFPSYSPFVPPLSLPPSLYLHFPLPLHHSYHFHFRHSFYLLFDFPPIPLSSLLSLSLLLRFTCPSLLLSITPTPLRFPSYSPFVPLLSLPPSSLYVPFPSLSITLTPLRFPSYSPFVPPPPHSSLYLPFPSPFHHSYPSSISLLFPFRPSSLSPSFARLLHSTRWFSAVVCTSSGRRGYGGAVKQTRFMCL